MSANEIHKGDIGTVISITIKDSATAVDISGATTKYFVLQHPGSSLTTITANFTGSGTAGTINFTSTSSHFDTTGTFKLQVHIADATGTWRSDIYEFFVYPNLE